MRLSFIKCEFSLKFILPVFADTNPLFVLRSMMGKNLRAMCCVSRQSVCAECQFCRTCAYAFLFETILPTENSVLPGRNRASHPFSFVEVSAEYRNQGYQKLISKYVFKITLFGRAIEYLPYIYAALVRSGQDGLFKSRTQFEIESVFTNRKNILIDGSHLDLNFETGEWRCGFEDCRHSELDSESVNEDMLKQSADDNESQRVQHDDSDEYQVSLSGLTRQSFKILINLKSPLRFKVQGKYTSDFSATDFMNCLFRRAKTLCYLYGEISEEEKNLWKISTDGIEITERNLRWQDERHYSSRQKKVMELGGVSGTFKMEGDFTEEERALLDFAEIAGAGKNTNFGLGQVEVWEK